MVNDISSQPLQGRINTEQLLYNLWQKKWLILFFTLLFMGLGTIFVLNKKQVYEATAYIELPTESDVVVFNSDWGTPLWINRKFARLLKPLNDLTFLNRKILISNSIKQNFFRNYYLPAFQASPNNKLNADQIFKLMEKKITLKDVPIPGEKSSTYILTIRGNDPEQITTWANAYINLAQSEIREKIENLSQNEIQALLQNLNQQVNSLKSLSRLKRLDKITQLEEALELSQRIKQNNREGVSNSNHDATALAITANKGDSSPMYLRNPKAIKGEIAFLNNRKSDDVYSDSALRELEEAYRFYKEFKLNPKLIPVATLSDEVAVRAMPTHSALVLCFFTLIGFMSGGFIALFGSIIKQLRQN